MQPLRPPCIAFALVLLSASVLTTQPTSSGKVLAPHTTADTRAFNKDGSLPTYKDPKASLEARVADLLPRMTIEEKVAQMYAALVHCPFPIVSTSYSIQGDINGWMDMNDPLDNTKTFNQTGLVCNP